MSRTLEVLVGANGAIKIEAVGFTGADCERATKHLEQALGVVKVRQKKSEYHRCRHTQQRLTS